MTLLLEDQRKNPCMSLHTQGISDDTVLSAIAEPPRQQCVRFDLQELAYDDAPETFPFGM